MKDKKTEILDLSSLQATGDALPSAVIERERTVFRLLDEDYQTMYTASRIDYADGREYRTPQIAWEYCRSGDRVDDGLVEALTNPAIMAHKRSVIVEGMAQDYSRQQRFARHIELFPAPKYTSRGDIKGYENGFRVADFAITPDGLTLLKATRGTYKDGQSEFRALGAMLRAGINTPSDLTKNTNIHPIALTPRRITITVDGIAPTKSGSYDTTQYIDGYAAQLEKVVFAESTNRTRKIGKVSLEHF